MALKALIVDDEKLARKNLRMMLEELCPQDIEVIDEADGVASAKAAIESHNPQVVFLDIRMPSGAEGFELLDQVEEKKFLIVFVTAFKDYAIKAFNANAIHYLLKPIDVDDLQQAIDKIMEASQHFKDDPENFDNYVTSLKHLSQNLVENKKTSKISISHTKGLKIVDEKDILHLEASGNCTMIYFTDGSRYLDTRTLKVYENMLSPDHFYRVHKSHIINLDYLKEYLNEDGHFAVLEGGKEIPVARNRVSEFVKTIKHM